MRSAGFGLALALALLAPAAVAAPLEEYEPPSRWVALESRPETRFKRALEGSKLPQEPRSVRNMVIAAFPDAPVMVRIAEAESRFDPEADNPESTAYGVFQILEGTWEWHGCDGERGDPEDNIRCARLIYDREGTRPWDASARVWSR